MSAEPEKDAVKTERCIPQDVLELCRESQSALDFAIIGVRNGATLRRHNRIIIADTGGPLNLTMYVPEPKLSFWARMYAKLASTLKDDAS